MVHTGNESDEELAQRFLDMKPEDGVWASAEIIALHRAYANSELEDDPQVLEAVKAAYEAGLSWEWIGRGLHTSAEEARQRYGKLCA